LERPKVAEYSSLGGQFRFGETLIQSLKKLDLGENRKIDVPNYKENRNLFIEFLNKASTAYREGVPADTAYAPKTYWFLTKDQKRIGPYDLKTLAKEPRITFRERAFGLARRVNYLVARFPSPGISKSGQHIRTGEKRHYS
jgi:hypothetical protein